MPDKGSDHSSEAFFKNLLSPPYPVGSRGKLRRRGRPCRPVGGGEQPKRIGALREFDGLAPEEELDF